MFDSRNSLMKILCVLLYLFMDKTECTNYKYYILCDISANNATTIGE